MFFLTRVSFSLSRSYRYDDCFEFPQKMYFSNQWSSNLDCFLPLGHSRRFSLHRFQIPRPNYGRKTRVMSLYKPSRFRRIRVSFRPPTLVRDSLREEKHFSTSRFSPVCETTPWDHKENRHLYFPEKFPFPGPWGCKPVVWLWLQELCFLDQHW